MPSTVGCSTLSVISLSRSSHTSGVGQNAPMPPVLGPLSSSYALLWSCAGSRGSTVYPSERPNTLTSGPSSFSSMTTSSPASPNTLPSRHSLRAAMASSFVSGTTTPLPAARPDALTTTSNGLSLMYLMAASSSPTPLKLLNSAVGTLYLAMKSLQKALEPSNRAAALEGPNTLMPAAWSASTMPSTSGCSGPTATRSTPFALQKSMTSWKPLVGDRSNLTFLIVTRPTWTSCVPPLPGATQTAPTCLDCASFHAKVCSRPPLPITKHVLPKLLEMTP
mmetsp:Transcript_4882/g.11345  ORF Transcript_4882/g.11345 Transcript_4882/m.11345 type:complete len:278 (-) Transcript_4882:820-1653(-)